MPGADYSPHSDGFHPKRVVVYVVAAVESFFDMMREDNPTESGVNFGMNWNSSCASSDNPVVIRGNPGGTGGKMSLLTDTGRSAKIPSIGFSYLPDARYRG